MRRFVNEFYELVTLDGEGVSRLALAAHELLENAVRYAGSSETRLSVAVSRASGSVEGHIVTENRADARDLDRLRAKVSEITAAGSSEEARRAYYLREMSRAAAAGGPGGLGLPRIYAEASMDLTVATVCSGDEQEQDQSVVVVTARTSGWRELSRGPGPGPGADS